MPQMFGNLSIHPKLVTLLAVPVAGTALLAAAGAGAELGERAEAQQERRVAAVAELAVAAAHELQEERARALAWTGGRGRAGERALAARRARADWSLAAYRTGAAGLRGGDPALDRAAAAAAGRLGRLAVVRAEVDRRLVTGDRVTAELDTMVAALLEVTRELTDRLDAPGPARAGRLFLAVARAKEATGRERNLLAAPAPARPGATAAGAEDDRPAATAAVAGDDPRPGAAGEALAVRLGAVAAVARHELNGVRAAAGDRLDGIDRALAAPGVRRLRRLELGLLQPPAGPPTLGDLDGWRAGTADRAGVLRRVERQAAADLDAAARAELRLRDGRLRGRLALLGAAALATLATLAALAALGGLAGRRARPPAPTRPGAGPARSPWPWSSGPPSPSPCRRAPGRPDPAGAGRGPRRGRRGRVLRPVGDGGSTCSPPARSRWPGRPRSTWPTCWPSCSTTRPPARRRPPRWSSPPPPTATTT
jgi:hypothetical protein